MFIIYKPYQLKQTIQINNENSIVINNRVI